jgi:hypothetical protein
MFGGGGVLKLKEIISSLSPSPGYLPVYVLPLYSL